MKNEKLFTKFCALTLIKLLAPMSSSLSEYFLLCSPEVDTHLGFPFWKALRKLTPHSSLGEHAVRHVSLCCRVLTT